MFRVLGFNDGRKKLEGTKFEPTLGVGSGRIKGTTDEPALGVGSSAPLMRHGPNPNDLRSQTHPKNVRTSMTLNFVKIVGV